MIAASTQRARVRRASAGLGQDPGSVIPGWFLGLPFLTGTAQDSISTAAADTLSTIKYGQIPVPGDAGMGIGTQASGCVPAPAAPSTQAQMTTPGAWTPSMAATQGSAQYSQCMTAAIQAAETSGTYTPSGTLLGNLLTGDFSIPNPFSNPTTVLFLAVAGGIVLFALLRR